jgi:catechol 2,3-dioxygenase-like lactoylglutathione lyase family enzyme
MNRITGICIITRDVPRLRDFYCTVLQAHAEGDDTFSTILAKGAELSLCHERIMEQMAPHSLAGAGRGSYTLEVEVEDVDSEYQRLTANHIPIVKPPTTQPWGRRSVWLRDPDGNLANLSAKVED